LLAVLKHGRPNSPHHDTEDEKEDGEDSVIYCHLFSAAMPSPPIAVEDANAKGKGNTSDYEEEDLGPGVGVRSPWSEVISRRKILSSIEYGERRCKQGENYQTAAEVDATKEHLDHPNTCLDFLFHKREKKSEDLISP
jgi:hypothetical protein